VGGIEDSIAVDERNPEHEIREEYDHYAYEEDQWEPEPERSAANTPWGNSSEEMPLDSRTTTGDGLAPERSITDQSGSGGPIF
jgi:hypothetical protein